MSVDTLSRPATPAESETLGFYALVYRVDSGLLSKRVSEMRGDVLSGNVLRGEPVELVSADGRVVPAVARDVFDDPITRPGSWIRLDNPQPLRSDVGHVVIVRSPGLMAPILPPAGDADRSRFVLAIQTARRAGFPITPEDRTVVTTGFPDAPELAERFRSLPDEAIVLLVESRLRFARAQWENPKELAAACWNAAQGLRAIGLPEDGDRILLAVAGALQGRTTSLATDDPGTVVSTVGTLVGGGDAWNAGAQWAARSDLANQGKKIERSLLASGRGTGIGWCTRCGDAVPLDLDLRCRTDHEKIKDPVVVVPSDVEGARAVISARYRPQARPWGSA